MIDLAKIKFNDEGLVPAIAQQYDSNEVLMMAWMNAESLQRTIETNNVCYYSRSRNKLWQKGEVSGQTQKLREIILDCDGDTLLLKVDQKGVACHTGRKSCFYLTGKSGKWQENQKPIISKEDLYGNNN